MLGWRTVFCYGKIEEIPGGSQNCTPKSSRLGQPVEIEHKGTKVSFAPKIAAARQMWTQRSAIVPVVPKQETGDSRRFNTIQNPRPAIPITIQCDSNNSIQFNTIQEPCSDVPYVLHVPIQSTTSIPSDTNDIRNPLQTRLVGDLKIDKNPPRRKHKAY